MEILSLIISLISGIAGGNIAGATLPADKSLGTVGNSVAGLFGGGIGNFLLQAAGLLAHPSVTNAVAPGAGFDISQLLANVGGSGVGGAVLMMLVGIIKNAMQKSA
jgi:uncharacterized membrane protein YeaQ/YmgE (transglycosylase-associated protein family)